MNRSIINNDRIWGSVLIALGIAAVLFQPFEQIDKYIRGRTDTALTFLLLIIAVALAGVAFMGRPTQKAFWLVWMVAP